MATNSGVAVRSRTSMLYVSFGLSQASATAVDTLILLFAAKVLFASERHIALLDAVGTIAFTVASTVFSLLWHAAPTKRVFTVLGFLSMGVPVFLFSSIGDMWMAYTLTILFEALMVLPGALTASHLTRVHSQEELPSVYGKLGATGSLGSALGLLLSIGWLAVASRFGGQGIGERTLFLALGLLIVFSAAGVWHATVGMSIGRQKTKLRQRVASTVSILAKQLGHGVHSLTALRAEPKPSHTTKPLTEPVLSDTMKTFLLLTALLNVGLGMSFTSTMLYVISGLEVASSITLLVVLVFRITSCLISNPAGNHLHHLMLFRFQQIAGFWRFVAVLALGLVASLPNGSWGIAAVLPLVAVCGISSGIMGVTGPVAVSMMVSPQRQPMSYLLFIAVTNGGAGVGAWLASLAAPNLGFPALLTLSALMFGIVLLMWHKL